MSNRQLAETAAVLAIKAGTANSTPLVTPYVAVQNVESLRLVAALGDMASETIDVAIYQATDTSGTGAKVAKAATQLAAHATNNDNKAIVVGMRKDELDLTNGFKFVAGRAVTGGATGGACGLVLDGGGNRYGPAADIDSTVVSEVKI